MLRKISNRILAALAVLLGAGAVDAAAQAYGSYTPYSIYGVGDLSDQGSAYSRTMGGVGIASRSNRFLNILNPAAVTERDSLAFMADFSVYGDNIIFRQGDLKSVSNTFNIKNLAMSFPLFHNSAMAVGVTPYSSTGYGYRYEYTDPELIGNVGNVTYTAGGQGGIYKAFAAAGVTFFKRLSVGAEFDYYFGDIEKTFNTSFSDASHNGINNTISTQVNGVGYKVGLQYEYPVNSRLAFCLGLTYSSGSNLRGSIDDVRLSSGSANADTLYHKEDILGRDRDCRLASEIGAGVSMSYADRFRAGFDYTRTDWTKSGMDSFSGFSATAGQSFRLGMELTPNRNDIRYYLNRVSYRCGAYYKQEYYKFDGNNVNAVGITLGATLPVYRWYNGLTVGVDFGQRGSVKNNLIRERYINFSIGINIFDIWFQKQKYD